jgi:hypothetical protein
VLDGQAGRRLGARGDERTLEDPREAGEFRRDEQPRLLRLAVDHEDGAQRIGDPREVEESRVLPKACLVFALEVRSRVKEEEPVTELLHRLPAPRLELGPEHVRGTGRVLRRRQVS